jgi:hypothetical protein
MLQGMITLQNQNDYYDPSAGGGEAAKQMPITRERSPD